MILEKTTFGKTPAALYLADYLNSLNKPLISKKAGRLLTNWRNTCSQLEQSNNVGILNAHNLLRIMNAMREKFTIDIGDELASNLVTNILVGEMKILIRKSTEIRKIETLQTRVIGKPTKSGPIINKSGYQVATVTENLIDINKFTVKQIIDDINADTLTEKWKIKMIRKNKHIS